MRWMAKRDWFQGPPIDSNASGSPQLVCGPPHTTASLLAERINVMEGLDHNVPQFLKNLCLFPVVIVEVLAPFKITDHHTAGVAQDIGHHHNSLFEKYRICLGGRRGIGEFQNKSRPHLFGVVSVHLVGKRGRKTHIPVLFLAKSKLKQELRQVS